MKPLKQIIKHDPENGTYGDCHRTCYAMLLDREHDGVPHFAEHGLELFFEIEKAWLESEGLLKISFAFPPIDTIPIRSLLKIFDDLNPGIPFILGGTSKIGTGHSVVYFEGEMYDPSENDTGIVGPMSDGFYWIEYITRKL